MFILDFENCSQFVNTTHSFATVASRLFTTLHVSWFKPFWSFFKLCCWPVLAKEQVNMLESNRCAAEWMRGKGSLQRNFLITTLIDEVPLWRTAAQRSFHLSTQRILIEGSNQSEYFISMLLSSEIYQLLLCREFRSSWLCSCRQIPLQKFICSARRDGSVLLRKLDPAPHGRMEVE